MTSGAEEGQGVSSFLLLFFQKKKNRKKKSQLPTRAQKALQASGVWRKKYKKKYKKKIMDVGKKGGTWGVGRKIVQLQP